jgi:hypothetical protein
MYVNTKMIPVQTVPGMGGSRAGGWGWGWGREVEGKFKFDIFDAL